MTAHVNTLEAASIEGRYRISLTPSPTTRFTCSIPKAGFRAARELNGSKGIPRLRSSANTSHGSTRRRTAPTEGQSARLRPPPGGTV